MPHPRALRFRKLHRADCNPYAGADARTAVGPWNSILTGYGQSRNAPHTDRPPAFLFGIGSRIDYTDGEKFLNHARSGEKSAPGSCCALSHCGPARGQPLLSGADPRILTGSPEGIVMAYCCEQFFLAGRVIFCRDICARLFWDFTASGAGRRRPYRHRDRMDAAEAARRRKTRRAQNRPATGHIQPGVLSLDDATDSRPRIDLRGDHARRERCSPPLVPAFEYLGCTHWIGVDRDQYFALLWICRSASANPGSNGDDGDHAIVVVFPRLHRCADCMERD